MENKKEASSGLRVKGLQRPIRKPIPQGSVYNGHILWDPCARSG